MTVILEDTFVYILSKLSIYIQLVFIFMHVVFSHYFSINSSLSISQKMGLKCLLINLSIPVFVAKHQNQSKRIYIWVFIWLGWVESYNSMNRSEFRFKFQFDLTQHLNLFLLIKWLQRSTLLDRDSEILFVSNLCRSWNVYEYKWVTLRN